MHLRPASLSDLELLRYWHAKPHLLAVLGDFAEVDWQAELAHTPDWRELLIAECDGRPIGVIQIIDPALEETNYWGNVGSGLRAIDIWIGEAADLGRGHGTQMMRLALERCFGDPEVSAVLVDPLAGNTRARRFYERLGFQPIELREFGTDECFVYRLEGQRWHACSSGSARPHGST